MGYTTRARDAVGGRGAAEERVNDGQEIGQALAGAGAAGDHIALPRAGSFHRLDLVLVKDERLAAVVTEDLCGLGKQDAACGQFVHGGDTSV